MSAITKPYEAYELPPAYAPSAPSFAEDPAIETFLQKAQELVTHQPSFSFFSFSDISQAFSSLGRIPATYVDRSTHINIGNSTRVERQDSEERKEARKNQQMILSTVIAAIYSFVLGRQLGAIAEEQEQKDQCDAISLSYASNLPLCTVAAARKKVHERRLEDACFYRNISISAIASSALVFVGAAYAAPAAGIAGATLGFGTVVYGMVQLGASSVSKDTLASRYDALKTALEGCQQGQIPVATPVEEF